jgi:hypothetical protein
MRLIRRTGGAAMRGPALEALLQRAAREPRVRTVRATISPGNVASYRLAAQYGFTEVGQQWDDEDGLEIIYEVGARTCEQTLISHRHDEPDRPGYAQNPAFGGRYA